MIEDIHGRGQFRVHVLGRLHRFVIADYVVYLRIVYGEDSPEWRDTSGLGNLV